VRYLKTLAMLGLMAASSTAGTLVNGVLTVEGKPFFPVGSWNGKPAAHVTRLGFNAVHISMQPKQPQIDEGLVRIRECARYGLQVVPYAAFGGGITSAWPDSLLRQVAAFKSEPNLLAFYCGDDIRVKNLPALRENIDRLRKWAPGVPTVADYIDHGMGGEDARKTFTEYVDIRPQYSYPVPDVPFMDYLRFFDDQRTFVGDPLWTWIQCFEWGSQAELLNHGLVGFGPVPDAAQVRLMSYIALNRGVRGLWFYAHFSFSRLPELAAEAALAAREVRLFNDYLAAGKRTYDLAVSDTTVKSTAVRHAGSVLLVNVIVRPGQPNSVGECVARDITVTCPWTSSTTPRAILVDAPDAVPCTVTKGPTEGTLNITIPRLDLAGFVFVSSDPAELARVTRGTAAIADSLARLMLPAAVAETRKAHELAWQMGWDNHSTQIAPVSASCARVEQCADATVAGRFGDAMRSWRTALRGSRVLADSVYRSLLAQKEAIPVEYHKLLISPYGIRTIKGLQRMPAPDDPWRFVRNWEIAGPFPLEWDGRYIMVDEETVPTMAPGFMKVFPPEEGSNGPFETVDGRTGWKSARSDVSGLLDFLMTFRTSDNVLCYARSVISAPSDTTITMGIGSNDGARVWVNGKLVYSENRSGEAFPHWRTVEITLKKGQNSVLAKVINFGRRWKLFLSVKDPDRTLSFPEP
jgi:hypothetical protein